MTKIVFVGEAWGEMEAALRFPLVGPSGYELFTQLDDSGLVTFTAADRECIKQRWNASGVLAAQYMRMIWEKHPEIHLTNVFNLRPENNDLDTLCTTKTGDKLDMPALRAGKYIRREFGGEIARLISEIKIHAPNLVIALGGVASWALLHNPGISRIRGTVALSPWAGVKVLPVYHPAAILRQYDLRAVTVIDFEKAKYESNFKEVRRPERRIYVEPTLSDLEWFFNYHIAKAKYIAPDIETVGRQISCIGFATAPDTAIVVPFIDLRTETGSYWKTAAEEVAAWRWVQRVLATPTPKIFQNGIFDVNHLWATYGIKTVNFAEDCMLIHHALQPESLKGLGFLGSVYTNEASWKLLGLKASKTIKKDE